MDGNNLLETTNDAFYLFTTINVQQMQNNRF